MPEEHVPKVVNAHHFGGSDNLPPNTIYIGRPSPHGNHYSSKTGKYTKEECIALHRIDLYRSIKEDPSKLAQLRVDLGGHDLACWCKQDKRIVGCHGDTYVHILSPATQHRDYTKSIISYLMEDLRLALDIFSKWARTASVGRVFLDLYDDEIRMEINHVLRLCKENNATNNAVAYLLARIVVDVELANQRHDVPEAQYRINHAIWVISNFISGRTDRAFEPTPVNSAPKRKPKGKT